jgi:hypothetical protein
VDRGGPPLGGASLGGHPGECVGGLGGGGGGKGGGGRAPPLGALEPHLFEVPGARVGCGGPPHRPPFRVAAGLGHPSPEGSFQSGRLTGRPVQRGGGGGHPRPPHLRPPPRSSTSSSARAPRRPCSRHHLCHLRQHLRRHLRRHHRRDRRPPPAAVPPRLGAAGAPRCAHTPGMCVLPVPSVLLRAFVYTI